MTALAKCVVFIGVAFEIHILSVSLALRFQKILKNMDLCFVCFSGLSDLMILG